MCGHDDERLVETFTNEEKGLVLRIYQDTEAENPREGENFGKMLCWHRKYKMGDIKDFENPEDFMEYVERENIVFLPVFMYEHTGICLSTSDAKYPFSDRFDAGQLGYIYMSNEVLIKEFDGDREKAVECLKAEVVVYSAYLSGEVFSYVLSKAVYDENGEIDDDPDAEGDFISSCGGFYGDDYKASGLFEAAEWEE